MTDATMSDIAPPRGDESRGRRSRPALYVAFRANLPLAATSRHFLDGIDEVTFGRRDARGLERDVTGRCLRLYLDDKDKLISSDHGRLVRDEGQWRLEVPFAKNRAVVAGRASRCAMVRPGDLFELGHTLFRFDVIDAPVDLLADVLGSELEHPLPGLASLDPDVTATVDLLTRLAPTDLPVLLHGRTGTGKEVWAHAVHHLSGRKGPFVAVNCGAFAPNMIEAELFGHRKGAFTGATADRLGYVRTADKGTLFLDEIGELPLPAQTALLRVLQERVVVPVGDATPIAVDLRVCAATHKDLPAMVAAGTFREDLFARLNGVSVTLPSLQQRRSDVGMLIGSLLRRTRGGEHATFTAAAARAMLSYRWPRNVRELGHALERAVALAGGGRIELEHLPAEVAQAGEPLGEDVPAAPLDRDDPELRRTFGSALVRHHGNLVAVGRELDKHREQLHRWARRFEFDLEWFGR